MQMDRRIKELIHFTAVKLGLDHYYLVRHELDRNVNIFNETVYTLSMEWFPNDKKGHEDDDLNPDGTAVIELDIHSRRFASVIFVGGKTYANGVKFPDFKTKDVINWVERETGLTYGEQFHLYMENREEKRVFQFKGGIDGIPVFPSGFIEIKCDEKWDLTSFSVIGQFPPRKSAIKEIYTLTLDQVENNAIEQLKLVEYPSFDQEKLYAIYAVEEVFLTNIDKATIPFEAFANEKAQLKMNKTIDWDKPLNNEFKGKEIHLIENVTAEQVFSCAPSPDSFPITAVERDQCLSAVKDFLRQKYPQDAGNWNVKTLHREKGYIQVTLRMAIQNGRVFQRKLAIMIDAHSLKVVNYLDNESMLEMFDQFLPPEQVLVTKAKAYEKLKRYFELTPYYVYDVEKRQYVLCGKLDCQFGVNATTGSIILLDDL